ncbi:MAG: hypothetical protein AB1429_08380 [Pseudomonadota bacterium]|jgi:hypothetical protein
MKLRAVGAVLVLSGIMSAEAALALPPDPSGSAPKAAKTVDRDPNEVICERQDDTGSRVSAHKVCKTRAEWEAQRAETQKRLQEEIVSKGTQLLPPG